LYFGGIFPVQTLGLRRLTASYHANQNRSDKAECGNDGDEPQLIGECHATLLGGCSCCMGPEKFSATRNFILREKFNLFPDKSSLRRNISMRCNIGVMPTRQLIARKGQTQLAILATLT